ncbi:MAG: hypothetical protein HGGPFJEG_03071 [Ignavibacteria bacterium]|nr:hypothetical protein [Ignavibacteria bacterium]
MDLNKYSDVELILNTGEYLFKGVLYGFDKGRLLKSPPSKYESDKKFFKIKYTGTEKSILQNFMTECFTVAGVLNYDLQEKLKLLARETLKSDKEQDPKKIFVEKAKELISQYQYDGKTPPDGHLKTNFRTAVSSAYHGSMWNKITGAGIYVAGHYKTRKDNKVRTEHRSLDDKIYYLDDPIWKLIWCPNGFGCRCYVKPLTQNEITGKEVENPLRTDEDEKKIIKDAGISKDFARNSGLTHSIWNKWLDSELKNKDIDTVINRMKEYANGKMPAKDSIVEESLKQDSKLFAVSNEVWGIESYDSSNKVYVSTIYFIKFLPDSIQVITSKGGALSEVKTYGYEKLDDLRKGVLIKINK